MIDLNKILREKTEKVIDSYFSEEKLQEYRRGFSPKNMPSISSEDRADLVSLYDKIKDIVDQDLYYIAFNQDRILISSRRYGRIEETLKPFMASLLEHMLKKDMKISPLPEVKIRKDLNEMDNPLGRTGEYDPETKTIILYVQGRHPKDILRTFCHEMIHHSQNLQGSLESYGTNKITESEHLSKIEEEAYLKGNITFREWEDSLLNHK